MSYEPNPKPSGAISGALGVGATQANQFIDAHSTNQLQVSARPTRLYSSIFTNRSGGDLYYMIFDKNTVPVNGETPDGAAYKVADGATGFFDYPSGRALRNGCVIVASTTAATLTLAGATSDIEANFA